LEKMFYYNDDSNFNLFRSTSYQIQNENNAGNNLKNRDLYYKNLSDKDVLQFQNEIQKYERKVSLPDGKYNYRGNNNYHFDFIGRLNLSPEKKESTDKKGKIIIDINNVSIIKRKIESNSLYVGFENKYGENSCYINVVLHFLYFFPCINEYLIKLYQTYKDTINFSNGNITNINNIDFFLFLLGKTLLEYQTTLSNLDNKGITILQTTELRKYLDLISNNFYKFNKVADPVELLTFLLNIINKNNQKEVHKYFFINLVEETKCSESCQKRLSKKYDKDNFIYHIYVDEIIHYINQNHLHFHNYNHNLFKLSKIISLNELKNCDKCGNPIKKILKCKGPNYPTFLLLNCVWNNQKPELKDVIKFLYLLSLEDDLNNLFLCSYHNNNNQRIIYNLLGMILYSSALSHYINVLFDIQKNVFVLFDDDKIKELKSIHDVYKEITAEQIKKNSKAFFYPVLLIYYKEIIYDDCNTMKINEYTIQKYNNLVEECKKAKKQSEVVLNDEQKRENYLKYVEAQKKFERENICNYFNDNNNLGSSSLYKVTEENDDGKDSGSISSNSFKMIIEEESKEESKDKYKNNNKFNNNNRNSFNIINNENNNNDKINDNNNNINNNQINKNNDNNKNNMNIESEEINNMNSNKNDNILEKKMNLPLDNNNKIYDQFFNLYKSGQNIFQIKNSNNGLFSESSTSINNQSYIKRNDKKHGTDSKSYSHHHSKKIDFFNNIL